MSPPYRFAAALWEYEGPASWFFLSLPPDIADDIAEEAEGRTGGFGSVRVHACVGTTHWSTSLFPDKKRGTYLLPMKRAVRLAEDLHEGAMCHVEITVA